nr:hypothetical protein BaRGS_000297 [Batillaria attramentaria]
MSERVEFKLDIGKRRLPSPDVKKPEKVRAPEFVVKPRRQFVDEGQSAKFKVSYDGSPSTFTWTKDGKPLSSGSKFKIYEQDGYHYLEVLDVESGDSGIYVGTVQNSAGTDTASAELDVFEKPKLLTRGAKPPNLVTPLQDLSVAVGERDVRLECQVSDSEKLEPPVFTKELQDMEVEDGDKVELVVEVRGTLPIQVYWLHNNCPVTVDTPGCILRAADGVHSLIIPHAGPDSVGDVKGHPLPNVTWERNGCTLSTNKKYQITNEGNSHSLEILAPDKSDAGQYICRAENCAGSVSHTCSLVISHTKPAKSAQVDFRNVLKSRQPVGQIRKQGSTESERSDKENEARDFRSVLRNNRQATPPPSTATRDSKAPTTTVNSTQRPASSASVNPRGGLRKALDLFEKNNPSTQEQTKSTSQWTSAPLSDRVKSAPVQESVYNKSSSRHVHIAPSTVKTSAGKDFPRTTGPSHTDPVKTDFRSVLSNRQRNFEKNGHTSADISRTQVKDSKPLWSKDSSSYSTKNGHNRDAKSLPPSKVDFRNVLKNKLSDREEKPPPSRDLKSKPVVQSKDLRSTVLGRKSVFEEKRNELSHSTDREPSQDRSTIRPVSKPKDINSLKSRFESPPAKDFREVQLKSVKPQLKAENPAVKEKPERPTDLKIQIPVSQRTTTFSRTKEPEVFAQEADTTRPPAFSPLSDSSFLSDSSKFSDNSKTSEASIRSDDTKEDELTDFQTTRKVDRWRENGRAGRRRSSDLSQRPSIQDRLSDQRVRYGSKAVLQCTVVGVPEPDIKWSINKKAIKPSKFFRLSYVENVAQLVVAEAFSEDEGEYTCTATNTAGTDSCSCYLTVEASSSQSSRSEGHAFEGPVHTPPRVLTLAPRDITVQRGQPVRIDITFCGEPAPIVRWFKAKTEISPDKHFKIVIDNSKSSLVIDAVSPNDAGRYTITVTNDLGSDLMSATINVEDVPEPPIGKPHVYDISRRSVSLSWCGPPFDGGCQVTHYAIEVRESNNQRWTTLTSDCQSTSYHALNLKPERSYQFRVRAGNKLGLSDPSDISEAVVMTDPLHTSEDYESDGPSEVFSPTIDYRGRDELPFEPRQVDIKTGNKFEDHYELLQEVGKGKFGNVYKCREKATDKYWAAKVVKCREKEKDNLRLEVKVMNQLAHPKLLMLWDAFEEPRKMVLIMEYVGAGELFERVIREDFVLTEGDCVHFVRQICSGVGYMHSQSILHLDLKPENVLCVSDNSNQIKIIDFGLARFYKPGESIRVLFGTPEFIAPEVINYDEISFATDLWSIGVICYILLSGLSPFLGDNDPETLANVTSGDYDFDDDSFEDISENAKDFIRRLLVKRKEKRNTIKQCLEHPWLAQEDTRIRSKRLNTERLKCFMARRKWQK